VSLTAHLLCDGCDRAGLTGARLSLTRELEVDWISSNSKEEIADQADPSATVRADGTANFGNVWPGLYGISIRSPNAYTITRVLQNGKRLLSGRLVDIGPGESMSITVEKADRGAGEIVGSVRGASCEAQFSCWVELLPANQGTNDPPRSTQIKRDGTYDLKSVHAGQYRIWAVKFARTRDWRLPDLDPDWWKNPERATPVRVAPGSRRRADLEFVTVDNYRRPGK
jgi:hypothetical protein